MLHRRLSRDFMSYGQTFRLREWSNKRGPGNGGIGPLFQAERPRPAVPEPRTLDEMNPQMPVSARRWRSLFLVLETIVLVPFVISMGFTGALRHQSHSEVALWQYFAGGLYLMAWLFLLIASPFFLRSLRWVALSGWIIGFGTLLIAALFPRL